MVFKFSFIKYGTLISLKEAINLLMDSKHTSWCIAFHTNSLFLCLQCNMCIIITYHWQNAPQKSHVKCISHIALSHIHSNAFHALQQISITSVLILNSHLHPTLPSCLFLLRFPTKTLHTPVLNYMRVTCPAHLRLLDLTTRNLRRTNHEAPHCTISSSPLQLRPWLTETPSWTP